MREALTIGLAVLGCGVGVAADPPAPEAGAIRVATYNIAMYRDGSGQLAEELRGGESVQAQRIAEVIQRVRPDVLLLCEIDFAPGDDPPGLFAERYLAKPQAGCEPIVYPQRFTAPVNTGVPSGLDLNGDGDAKDPEDAWGYGRYPGQYGMAVLSHFPIDREATRTFQRLGWADLPGADRPVIPDTGDAYYPDDVWRRLRLPSKSFWDVVVQTPGGAIHALCSHPTPPVFDGPEDRNGRRNADEIRLVRHYVEGKHDGYFTDDAKRTGALGADDSYVILGDLNADPRDGDGELGAINRLLSSDRNAADPKPRSDGAVSAASAQPGFNAGQRGDPAYDTADFSGDGYANLRVDYALPSADLDVVGSGVYWPQPDEPGGDAVTASDHRLVWVDVRLTADAAE